MLFLSFSLIIRFCSAQFFVSILVGVNILCSALMFYELPGAGLPVEFSASSTMNHFQVRIVTKRN